jgi:hypothetical protein
MWRDQHTHKHKEQAKPRIMLRTVHKVNTKSNTANTEVTSISTAL